MTMIETDYFIPAHTHGVITVSHGYCLYILTEHSGGFYVEKFYGHAHFIDHAHQFSAAPPIIGCALLRINCPSLSIFTVDGLKEV